MKAILFLFSLLFVGTPANADEGSTLTLDLGKNVTAKVSQRPFDGAQVRIEQCRDGAGICRINGGTPFGISSGLPRTVLAKLTVTVGGRTYELDTSNMYDAWGKRQQEARQVSQFLAAACYDQANCVVRGLFSEGAHAYVAEWAIVDGKASRTMLTGSNDVVELFDRKLAPPAFE